MQTPAHTVSGAPKSIVLMAVLVLITMSDIDENFKDCIKCRFADSTRDSKKIYSMKIKS